MTVLGNLFVYGSLRRSRDGTPHPLLREADYLGAASLEGRLFEVAGYPGVVLAPGSSVHGELYGLRHPEMLLPTLDNYEECSPSFPEPHEYRRVSAVVVNAAGEMVEAWLYVYNRPTVGLAAIATGDYRQFLPEQR